MHPKEAKKQRTGTGRLSHLCLPQSEILVGIDFTNNEHLNSLINDPKYQAFLMYPGEDALTASSPKMRELLCPKSQAKKKIPLIIIIDSTWFCSKKMIKQSKNLHTLPKLSFSGSYKSIFTFKTEPEEYCISTIESCYYMIKEMQKENERITLGLPSTHPKDYKYTKIKEIPNFNSSDQD